MSEGGGKSGVGVRKVIVVYVGESGLDKVGVAWGVFRSGVVVIVFFSFS